MPKKTKKAEKSKKAMVDFATFLHETKVRDTSTTDIVLVVVGDVTEDDLQGRFLGPHQLQPVARMDVRGVQQRVCQGDETLFDSFSHDSGLTPEVLALASHDLSLIDPTNVPPPLTDSNTARCASHFPLVPDDVIRRFHETNADLPYVFVYDGQGERLSDATAPTYVFLRPTFAVVLSTKPHVPLEKVDIRIQLFLDPTRPTVPLFVSTLENPQLVPVGHTKDANTLVVTSKGLTINGYVFNLDNLVDNLEPKVRECFDAEGKFQGLSSAVTDMLDGFRRLYKTSSLQVLVGELIRRFRTPLATTVSSLVKTTEFFQDIDPDNPAEVETAVTRMLQSTWKLAAQLKQSKKSGIQCEDLETALASFAGESLREHTRTLQDMHKAMKVKVGAAHLVRKAENYETRLGVRRGNSNALDQMLQVFPTTTTLCLSSDGFPPEELNVAAALRRLGLVFPTGAVSDVFRVTDTSNASIILPVLEFDYSILLLNMDYRDGEHVQPLRLFAEFMRKWARGRIIATNQQPPTPPVVTKYCMEFVLQAMRLLLPTQPGIRQRLTLVALLFVLSCSDDVPFVNGMVDLTTYPRRFTGDYADFGYDAVCQALEMKYIGSVFGKQVILLCWAAMKAILSKERAAAADHQREIAKKARESIQNLANNQPDYCHFDDFLAHCRRDGALRQGQAYRMEPFIDPPKVCNVAVVDGQFVFPTPKLREVFERNFPVGQLKKLEFVAERYLSSFVFDVLAGAVAPDVDEALLVLDETMNAGAAPPPSNKTEQKKTLSKEDAPTKLDLDSELFHRAARALHYQRKNAMNALFGFDVSRLWVASGMDLDRLGALVKQFVYLMEHNYDVSALELIQQVSQPTIDFKMCALFRECEGVIDANATASCGNPKCTFVMCKSCSVSYVLGKVYQKGKVLSVASDLLCPYCTTQLPAQLLTAILANDPRPCTFALLTSKPRFYFCNDPECTSPDWTVHHLEEAKEEVHGDCGAAGEEKEDDVLPCPACNDRHQQAINLQEQRELVQGYVVRNKNVRFMPCCQRVVEHGDAVRTACFHLTCTVHAKLGHPQAHLNWSNGKAFASGSACMNDMNHIIRRENARVGTRLYSVYTMPMYPNPDYEGLENVNGLD